MGVFHAAAIAKSRNRTAVREGPGPRQFPGQLLSSGMVSHDDWIHALVKGADDRSATWKHLLVLGGLVVGLESQEPQAASGSLRSTLRNALIRAANLALEQCQDDSSLGGLCTALVLNYSFTYLTDAERSQLDFDVRLNSCVYLQPCELTIGSVSFLFSSLLPSSRKKGITWRTS